MKQIFSVMFDSEEVVEIGQVGVPLMNALHIKSIEVERVFPTQRAGDLPCTCAEIFTAGVVNPDCPRHGSMKPASR